MMSLIIFIFILSILILVHEWGHFITARKCGVKVEQFALGFGPKLFGWTHDGTEFCLCAIPLGGFVKMAGDERDKCLGGSDEYFAGDGVCLVEWADRVEACLPRERLSIVLEPLDECRRNLTVMAIGQRYEKCLAELISN